MNQITGWGHYGFAAIGGYIGYFLGGFDGFLYALVAFVVIDYITGLMVAVIEKAVLENWL